MLYIYIVIIFLFDLFYTLIVIISRGEELILKFEASNILNFIVDFIFIYFCISTNVS